MAHGLLLRLYVTLAPWLLVVIEFVLIASAVGLTLLSKKSSTFIPWSAGFSRLARRKPIAIFVSGASVIVFRVALIPILGVPNPAWHDEFSFLLAADTFAHGRLTNPTHPLWIHFESFHIIQHPTYTSMYPPGQGLILALGQVLGHPWIGQLLATALMCAALCWMLQAWLPARWALLGAAIAVLRIGLLSYWVNSYFGTSLPALGGVLMLGALPRILRKAQVRDALLMAVGVAVVANTRPFEGFVFSLPIAGFLLAWVVKQKKFPALIVAQRVVVPLVVTLAVAAGATGYYFWRVTGSAFTMPYQVNRRQYAVAPYFIWQKPSPEPSYHNAEMRNFYIDYEYRSYAAGTTLIGFTKRIAWKAIWLWEFYLGAALTLPLLAFPRVLRDRRMRLPLLILAFVAAGCLVESWTGAHYVASAIGVFYLLMLQSLRHLRLWRWRGRRIGHGLARAVPAICVAMVVLRVTAAVAGAHIEPPMRRGNPHREEITREVDRLPGKQLVIVRYASDHIPHTEWVYNRADIDGSKTVWARDLGFAANQDLLRYFKDRTVWTVDADDPRSEPVAYKP